MFLTCRRFSVLLYAVATLCAGAALYAYWAYLGRSVTLPDSAGGGHRLQCVSYSPFARDQSPLDADFQIRPERMDADLALLARYFTCVRTYSMTGLERLPEFAQKHGLKVMLGAWVSPDAVATQREIDLLVRTANRYPDVVQSVIVGNEALLRKDISATRLAALITEVKQRVKQPVTYADVWEFWLKHPQLATAVDFITIHLLPYWEDDPTSGARALEHVAQVHDEVLHRFASKPVFIGEVGWPSEGRQRETAVASRVEQARFLRGFVALAERRGWQYNLIEAFDQPWKRNNEGAVGGYWGLFDADRHDKHILAGPVSNLPDWRHWWWLSAAIAMATLAIGGLPARRSSALLVPPLAALGAACIALWWQQAAFADRNGWEWAWTALLSAIDAAVLLRAMLAAAPVDSPRGWLSVHVEQQAGRLLLLSAFTAAVLVLQLALDARYRLFPSYVLLLPALVFLRWPARAPVRELGLLLAAIVVAIPWQLWQEGLANTQALVWAGVSTLFALALWRSLCISRRAL